MNNYEAVIGLEIHAELNTASKIFCSCKNAFSHEPNTQVCPVCMGFPGALPVLNEAVVDFAIRMGHALHCHINPVSVLSRKHYFYPDLPKAYQISQGDIPLCENGFLDYMMDDTEKRVRIQRIHIEEDAGKLLHDELSSGSLVDFNRCGVPLIEIVTEPDIRSSAEARSVLETIRSILQYLNISDCKMQEGSIRCDVNVSMRPMGESAYGTRCEMKNVNSFSGAVRGIDYEIRRQTDLLLSGQTVQQETRRWDDPAGKSIPMRSKEDAEDYRFFPEPDLLPLVISQARITALQQTIPELPNQKLRRYIQVLNLPPAEAALLAESPERSNFFDECNAFGICQQKNICNWILGDGAKYTNDTGIPLTDTCMTPKRLTALIAEVEKGTISNSAGKQVFQTVIREDREPIDIIHALGLMQNSDTNALKALVLQVLSEQKKSIADYRNGKTNVLVYLIGQCMKASGGTANPRLLKEIVSETLYEICILEEQHEISV